MASLNEVVPEDFVKHLQKSIPGFKAESYEHQCALARMAWVGGSKFRRHAVYEGAMTFSYAELGRSFGRGGFKRINARLQFFKHTDNWSKDKQQTRAYWFTPMVKEAHDAYMRKHWRGVTRLLYQAGEEMKAIRTLPAAVASLDKDGKRIKDAQLWKSAKELNKVRVDLATLKRLRKYLQSLLGIYRAGDSPSDLVSVIPDEEVIRRLHDMTAKITRMAQTDVAGLANVPHRYEVASSGRLYAEGYSLQNAPSMIKQAALHGRWEYDFSNCHYSLMAQMATQFGMDCPAIIHYLNNKPKVRQALAEAAGITAEQAKQCLLAFIYGATEVVSPKAAIPKEIGKDAAHRLYAAPEFRAIKDEITGAGRLIVESWPRDRDGRLVNDCGKPMAGDNLPKYLLAHILQGAEAAALRVAIRLHPDRIILLEHDGFVTHDRIPKPKAIEQAVFDELGYRLELEEEQIRLHPDAQFLRHTGKSVIARKANNGAGFSLPHVN